MSNPSQAPHAPAKKHRLIRRIPTSLVKRAARAIAYGLVGGFCVAITGFVLYLNDRPDLKVWHTVELDAEFTADSSVTSFEEYLALEDRLFKQLDEQVYAKIEAEDKYKINRYNRGSLSDPHRWPTNWNRSFELSVAEPHAGVLLLHGMSDSPYSLRSLGERLHDEGAWVVGLRIPGHGTAPSGLVEVQWEDMAEAVRLAARHVRDRIGDRPLYVVGYSNGGALAVLYALSTLEDDALPAVQGVVLISPEIRVTRLAALAVWQERLGHVLGLEKLSWNSIGVEYDPFKYDSFALNGGKQAYLLTCEIQSRIDRLTPTGALTRLPRVLAFQSVVDATVSARGLVENFFDRLPQGDYQHELVVFDINRLQRIQPLVKAATREQMAALLGKNDPLFALTIVTNENDTSREVVAEHWQPGDEQPTVSPLGLAWPNNLYSLSHIALPFPPDDPIYGSTHTETSPGIQLGMTALRGERGIMRISPSSMLRLRWNPFHAYLEQRILEFTKPALLP